jgi:hypothetical protein
MIRNVTLDDWFNQPVTSTATPVELSTLQRFAELMQQYHREPYIEVVSPAEYELRKRAWIGRQFKARNLDN